MVVVVTPRRKEDVAPHSGVDKLAPSPNGEMKERSADCRPQAVALQPGSRCCRLRSILRQRIGKAGHENVALLTQ